MDLEPADPGIQRFAAAVLHDLRTPLSALSSEVELALRRERSSAAYRETVARMGDLVEELLDHTRDLAAFADGYDADVVQSQTASLADCLSLDGRYPPGLVSIAADPEARIRRVLGDESLLRRAFMLLVDHATRHCGTGAIVHVRTLPRSTDPWSGDPIVVTIDASPGIPAHVWAPFLGGPEVLHAAALRLIAAARMVHACGGSLDIGSSLGSAVVHIRLRDARGK